MFYGSYERTMDEKGRVVIPTELRAELGEKFMAYAASRACVELLPEAEWQVLAQRAKDRDPFDEQTKRLARIYFGSAHSCTVDDVGRTRIPAALRETAGLGKEVVFVGALNRIELWDADAWRKERDKLLAQGEQ